MCHGNFRSPAGVVTISISLYGLESVSRTIIANTEVPADTFPVRCFTLLVATIPVPASPSGGHTEFTRLSFPSHQGIGFFCQVPASCPATRTSGIISRNFHGISLRFYQCFKLINHLLCNLLSQNQQGTYLLHHHTQNFLSCQHFMDISFQCKDSRCL